MHPFTLLGDPVRLRIVELLATGEHPAGDVAAAVGAEFGIGRTAVSHQLRILRDADFVAVRQEGNERHYRLMWNALDRTDRVLLDLYEHWDRRYDWPYTTDPLTPPPRRHRLAERTASAARSSEVEPLAREESGVPPGWE